jgi:monoamine oxidase
LDITTNCPVTAIDYSEDFCKVTTKTQGVLEADRVIVTVPLGVLQHNSIKFTPSLSAEKTGAINRLGSGIMTKLWIQFPEAFWEDELENDWINFISDRPGEWVQTLNLYKYLKVPVLLMFNIGNAAKQFEDNLQLNY